MINNNFGIKITSKLDRTHQSIRNSQTMLFKKREVIKKSSRKKSDKSFWNKNNIKLA